MTAVPVLRREISEYSRLLHDRAWVANHDGNVSVRAHQGILITPTSVSKRKCPPDSIVSVGNDGKPVGKGKPPSELALHLGAYRARPDVNAVIHAHPVHASAFSLSGSSPSPISIPEIIVSLGPSIPVVPLFLPKDPAVAESLGKQLQLADAVILTGNGALTVGRDLEEAFLRMELLEHYARIFTVARTLGTVPALSTEQIAKLVEMRKAAGLHREVPVAAKTEAKSEAAQKLEPKPSGRSTRSVAIRSIVEDEVRKALGGSE